MVCGVSRLIGFAVCARRSDATGPAGQGRVFRARCAGARFRRELDLVLFIPRGGNRDRERTLRAPRFSRNGRQRALRQAQTNPGRLDSGCQPAGVFDDAGGRPVGERPGAENLGGGMRSDGSPIPPPPRAPSYFSSRLRSIQAVFSWVCMRWVRRSAVGSSFAFSTRGKTERAVRTTASCPATRSAIILVAVGTPFASLIEESFA